MISYAILALIKWKKNYAWLRFRPAAVKGVIHDVLNEELSGKQYDPDEATAWSKQISDTVKEKLKGNVVL